jgi:hypothetical protein
MLHDLAISPSIRKVAMQQAALVKFIFEAQPDKKRVETLGTVWLVQYLSRTAGGSREN